MLLITKITNFFCCLSFGYLIAKQTIISCYQNRVCISFCLTLLSLFFSTFSIVTNTQFVKIMGNLLVVTEILEEWNNLWSMNIYLLNEYTFSAMLCTYGNVYDWCKNVNFSIFFRAQCKLCVFKKLKYLFSILSKLAAVQRSKFEKYRSFLLLLFDMNDWAFLFA